MRHDDTETESYRLEQGKEAQPDPRAAMGDVPIAFSTGGVLAGGHTGERPADALESDAANDARQAGEDAGAAGA